MIALMCLGIGPRGHSLLNKSLRKWVKQNNPPPDPYYNPKLLLEQAHKQDDFCDWHMWCWYPDQEYHGWPSTDALLECLDKIPAGAYKMVAMSLDQKTVIIKGDNLTPWWIQIGNLESGTYSFDPDDPLWIHIENPNDYYFDRKDWREKGL